MESESFDRKRQQADWLKRITAELVKLDESSPVKFLPEGEYPKWVQRVEAEIGRVMFPTAKLRDGLEMTPQRLGALLGQQCAYAVWMMEWLGEQFATAEANKTGPSASEEEIQQGVGIIKSLHEWYSALRRLAKRALCSSVDQTYDNMTDFLVAYSSAFARKPKTFKTGDIGSTNFEVYILLLMFWRSIERFKSVSELHSVLRKGLGEYRAGDLKRLEKICECIGLHFRKPGRPKKAK